MFIWVFGELRQLCAKFGKFWAKIHREMIGQSWLLLTPFFNFPIVHCFYHICYKNIDQGLSSLRKNPLLAKKPRQLQNVFEGDRTSRIRKAGSFCSGKMPVGDRQNVSFTFCYVIWTRSRADRLGLHNSFLFPFLMWMCIFIAIG